jgi:hypothetical protein
MEYLFRTTATCLTRELSGALLALTVACIASGPAQALPIYAARTGLPCGQCHINPEGGGPRTAFGRAFAANGYHLPGKRHRRGHLPESYSRGFPDHRYGPGMMGGYNNGMMGGYGHGMMGSYGR